MASVVTGRWIFSVGSSTRTGEEFLTLLNHYGIRMVADVRRFPDRSRFEHFTRKRLEEALNAAGLDYIFLGEALGGFRKGGYGAYTETLLFHEGIVRLEGIALEKVTAFMCAERLPWRCHRRFIGRELVKRGWFVIHLLDLKRSWIVGPEAPSSELS